MNLCKPILCLAIACACTLGRAEDNDLIRRLRSEDALTRSKAAQSIYESTSDPDQALLPILFEVLLRPRNGTPKEQIIALTAGHYAQLSIARCGAKGIPHLSELARDQATRWTAIGVINRIGEQAGEALPEI